MLAPLQDGCRTGAGRGGGNRRQGARPTGYFRLPRAAADGITATGRPAAGWMGDDLPAEAEPHRQALENVGHAARGHALLQGADEILSLREHGRRRRHFGQEGSHDRGHQPGKIRAADRVHSIGHLPAGDQPLETHIDRAGGLRRQRRLVRDQGDGGRRRGFGGRAGARRFWCARREPGVRDGRRVRRRRMGCRGRSRGCRLRGRGFGCGWLRRPRRGGRRGCGGSDRRSDRRHRGRRGRWCFRGRQGRGCSWRPRRFGCRACRRGDGWREGRRRGRGCRRRPRRFGCGGCGRRSGGRLRRWPCRRRCRDRDSDNAWRHGRHGCGQLRPDGHGLR
jgi:hypothetical protein